jgi:hypothetical protein
MKYFLLLFLSTYLFAQSVHSSLSSYYEIPSFSGSKQKTDGVVYGIGADIHHQNSEYKFTYEHADTETIQPPLNKNLHIDKLYLRYGYHINSEFALNFNYINILSDNIAITDNGQSFGAGVSYTPNPKVTLNFTQFYTSFEDFSSNQSDLKATFKTKTDSFKFKFTALAKYIRLKENNPNSFTKNAQDEYFTSALKIHAHYYSYHFGGGIYFGKRAFAVMNDGFKIQHHAMEFNKTYALGVGKSISNFVLRVQYVHQEATELPSENEGVKVNNLRFIVNYKL